jgi:FAD/FMN-containing dehydrogenase
VSLKSWGLLPAPDGQVEYAHSVASIEEALTAKGSKIAFGNGRSYGDVCLNEQGSQIALSTFDYFVDFDEASGILTCESGVLLKDIQRHFVPLGWALPVTPGTQLITVGGAIANDVHGKSHHVNGTFAHNVVSFTLLRSNGRIIECSSSKNENYFRATIGGIGLTGIILSVALKLVRVPGPWISTETIPFANSDEFFAISDEIDSKWSNSRAGGKGLLMVGNRVEHQKTSKQKNAINFPFTPPLSLINGASVKLLNIGYYALNRLTAGSKVVHYEKFFYPLDGIDNWNRAYGPRGFYQYQSVIPPKFAQEATKEMLRAIRESGEGSFLAVLKKFGSKKSLGMLSFPMKGTTLALDFPDRGESTRRLFERLDAIVLEAQGRLYLAKDARMSREMFEATYSNLDEFKKLRDPQMSSSMSRRLLGK